MKWRELPWHEKLGEIIAAFSVFAFPFLLWFYLEIFNALSNQIP